MGLLIDTGVLHGFLNRRDAKHEQSVQVMAGAMAGTYGRVATTPWVLDEAVTLARVRGQPYRAAAHLLGMVGLLSDSEIPPFITLVEVGVDEVRQAIPLQERHWDRGLSFTDCMSLHILKRDGLDAIATFNSGFQGLVATVPGG